MWVGEGERVDVWGQYRQYDSQLSGGGSESESPNVSTMHVGEVEGGL